MYPAKNNSPSTILTAGINSSDTTMTVNDASVLPAAPNLAVLGSTDSAEIVLYTAINGTTVTIVRGQNGTTAGTWASGTPVARNFTAADHEAFRENILDLDSRKLESVSWGSIGGTLSGQTDLQSAMDLKANLASPALTGTPTAPTASTSTNNTQIATTAFVQKHAPITLTGTISSGSAKTFSNSAITSTMRVIECVFGTPANVTSNVTWTTASGSITFAGTFAGSTTVTYTLIESN